MRRRGRPGFSIRPTGFTLVEVLVVIGVIGVIIGLVVPALSTVRAEADSTLCLSNLRQLFTAVDTMRQQSKDLLPFAAPLPISANDPVPVPVVPINEKLKAIVPAQSEIWRCPADETPDDEFTGISYVYVPGAFMLLEPPQVGLSIPSDQQRVARLITRRWTEGYLRKIPLLADNDDYHDYGGREPRNAVFIDGHARVVKPTDGNLAE